MLKITTIANNKRLVMSLIYLFLKFIDIEGKISLDCKVSDIENVLC